MSNPPRKIFQMAAVVSAMGSVHAAPPPRAELPPVAKLIGQLRKDAALRARFCLDPRSVFEATGIDATAYNLPDRMDEDDVRRFLNDWTEAIEGQATGFHRAAATSLRSRLPTVADAYLVASESPTPAPPDAPPPGKPPNAAVSPSPTPQPNEPGVPGETPRPPPVQPPLPTPVYGPPPGGRARP